MSTELTRIMVEIPRAAEYFTIRELQAQTGQPHQNFASVVLKELVDNALDASESLGQPEIQIELTWKPDTYIISVQDNGSGFPEEAIPGLLDFNIRASSKSIYAAPTRGAQGNALKTVLGIPFAMGSTEPIIIESLGKKHIISAYIDPAGAVRTQQRAETSRITTGTKVTVAIPSNNQDLDPILWAKAFSILNPHAVVKITLKKAMINQANLASIVFNDIYKSIVGEFQKHTITKATSPWWYTPESFARLVFGHLSKPNGSKPLGSFIREFTGLSSTRKAKSVLAQLPGVNNLNTFEQNPELMNDLLMIMQENSTLPKPESLGYIGKQNLEKRISEFYEIDRFWYQKEVGYASNIPFIFEIALAEVNDDEGIIYSGINFSPTFSDPFHNRFDSADISAYSLSGFLANAHCHTNPLQNRCGNKPVVAVAHLVSPVLQFMDRAKTRVSLENEIICAMNVCLEKVTRILYQEEKRRKKDASREERRKIAKYKAETEPNTLKKCVFHVLPEAVAKATGNGAYPVSARSLFYQVRPLIQDYTIRELDYRYFSQDLLTEYQAVCGPIALLYYDPRGYLYEPHTGKSMPLGTIEVREYAWPSWVYDKILYVEKKGLLPTLQAAQIAERYDMAIIAAEGFATEAARTLMSKAANDRQYKIFVLHDADPAGYEIARTLREETSRMPGHSLEIVDLGLHIEDAINMGLQPETFTRNKALPSALILNEIEKELFVGRHQGAKTWIAQRIELNAMSGPELINYIGNKLEQAGATEKLLPPKEIVARAADEQYKEKIRSRITAEIEKRLRIDEIATEIVENLPEPQFDELHEELTKIMETNPPDSWKELLQLRVEDVIYGMLPYLNFGNLNHMKK